MTAAALVTAGSVCTSGCAAVISTRRANTIAGLGSTWATRPAVSVDQHHRMPALVIPRTLSGPGQQPSTRLGQFQAPGLPHSEDSVGGNRGWRLCSRKVLQRRRGLKTRVFGAAAPLPLENVRRRRRNFISRHLSRSTSRIFSRKTIGAAHERR